MSGKKIVFYILAAFITGTLVLVYIQYNSTKNINTLTKGNLKYIDEYNVNSKLAELEKDVVQIESNVSDYISTTNKEFAEGIEAKFAKVNRDLILLQQVADDSSTVTLIDELDTAVRNKLDFSREILRSFDTEGKIPAENLISTLRGKQLMDSVYAVAGQIKTARHNVILNLNDSNIESGNKAETLNYILIGVTLVSAGVLFWYIISIIQRLILSERRLKEASRIKENFMANMSHEIRTPMNAVLGFTAMLERRNLDEQSKEYVRTIKSSAENLLTIINDILDLSKIEAGMMRIETAPFSIRELVHSVEVMFAPKMAEKNLSFKVNVDGRVAAILEGDATRLTQILINLIGNALKFTIEGGITVSITNEGSEGNVVKTGIIIRDTGIGIEKDKLQDIFNRFQQADDTITRHFGGTGLGLSIVSELVALQKGTIRVESEMGKGTVFALMIPYHVSESQTENVTALPENSHDTGESDFRNIRVLVAEDNEINQSLVRHLFKEWKLHYDLAQNGLEALDMIRQRKYDLVLMDIQMPEMDGYTATREIRHVLKLDTPIIAMTAHALAGEREKCLSYGMNEYIPKPIREAQLHQLISRFCKIPYVFTNERQQSANNYQFISLNYMKEISGGNKEYEKTVTEQFIDAVPGSLATIASAWQNHDIALMRQEAHNMKTTVSVMGLTAPLQHCLEELEYSDLTAETFSTQFNLLQTTCTGALAEARQFYKTISQ